MADRLEQLDFKKRAKRDDYGRYWDTRCGRYRVRVGDIVMGVKPESPRWHALVRVERVLGTYYWHIISHHRKRGPAEKACNKHFKQAGG